VCTAAEASVAAPDVSNALRTKITTPADLLPLAAVFNAHTASNHAWLLSNCLQAMFNSATT
jgi:hypothetical protein